MEKLIVPAAVVLAFASSIGCAGDTSDPPEEQVQQAIVRGGTGTNRGGIASDGVYNGNTPQGVPAANRPPTTQAATDDPVQVVEGR